MLDFEVRRFTRRCAKTDRELAPGEIFFSTLVAEGSEVVRYDYSADAWDGAPEKTLGWWKSQFPDPKSRKLHWAPNDVMLHYFIEIDQQPEKEDVRDILALLMIRRRILRLEETERDEQGREIMILYCPRDENEYSVIAAMPSEERAKEIQEELANLLFAQGE